jgi:hypothetical protein
MYRVVSILSDPHTSAAVSAHRNETDSVQATSLRSCKTVDAKKRKKFEEETIGESFLEATSILRDKALDMTTITSEFAKNNYKSLCCLDVGYFQLYNSKFPEFLRNRHSSIKKLPAFYLPISVYTSFLKSQPL